METLYCLTFFSNPNGDHREGFRIGLFRTCAEAEAVEQRYREQVPGFRDCDCEAEIIPVPLLGVGKEEYVYRFVGWNVNDALDEVDILESDCYSDLRQAETAFRKAKQTYPRAQWSLDRWTIGQCFWQDGFVRVSCE